MVTKVRISDNKDVAQPLATATYNFIFKLVYIKYKFRKVYFIVLLFKCLYSNIIKSNLEYLKTFFGEILKTKQKKWVYHENKDVTPELVEVAGSHVLAKLLMNRKIDTPEKAKRFLDLQNTELSSPYVFEHMEKAVEKINKLIESQEHITVYGDFDSDGVTSTSLLYKTLRYLNANVSFYIPDRSEEGHGLNTAAICRLISAKKTKLIITVDCGTSNLSEVTLAKGLGVDIIITDHHEPPEVIPPAFAIINPKTMQEDTDLKYLAGVGVAFKLASALLESNNKLDYIDDILYLVAIGTIGDVVPLIGENRALVYRGLNIIAKKQPQNLVKLLEIAGFKKGQNVSAEMIAFSVVPRINAIGRLEQASIAVDLLVSDDEQEIDDIVKKLNYNNRIRQQMCESAFIEATQKINNEVDLENDKAIILADSNWHPGIIGIVASKLVDKYYKPVFLISVNNEENKARCSARSIEGFHLHEILTNIGELFDQFGGHAFAAGFVLDLNRTKFEDFRNILKKSITESCNPGFLEPRLHIDMDLASTGLTVEFMEELNKLAPFGDSNPSPLFTMTGITLKQFKPMGSAKNHLKIFFEDNSDNLIEAVWWQQNSLDFEALDKVNVAFIPEINTFGDKTRIQLIIKDIKATEDTKITPIIEDKKELIQTVKWIDHRKRTDLEKSLSNYLTTSENKVSIFVENSDTLKFLDKYALLKSRMFNRLNIPEVEQVIIYDFPPDLVLFSEIIEKSKSKMIHIVGKNNNETDFKEMIKKLSSLLKYAFNNKNGEVSINQLASLLDTSNIAVNNSIKLLNKANVINISDNSTDIIKFEFIKSSDISSIISNIEEYNFCIESIKAVDEYRSQLAVLDILDIKSMIKKISLLPIRN